MAISISPGGSTGIIPSGPAGSPSFGGHSTPSGSQSEQRSQSTQQSTGAQQSNTYIPEYSQTPILNEIAQYSRNMAPQVYQWGMEQFNKNQGNIDAMMRNALTYGSAPRVASEMGKAQAGVMQGAEAGRQNAIRDLQSYGIDPSSGRYAALDKANQVMAGAAAAGAGNVQRDAVQKTASDMQGQAVGLSNQNVQTGYGAADAMNKLLGTGMQLKYSPLGTTSSGYSQSSGQSTGSTDSESWAFPDGGGSGGGGGSPAWTDPRATIRQSTFSRAAAEGGYISDGESPTGGAATDDVPANLTAGEFVIPKDVTEWKGQEFFYKLMAQARKTRATAGNGDDATMGYGADEHAPQL